MNGVSISSDIGKLRQLTFKFMTKVKNEWVNNCKMTERRERKYPQL